MMSNTDVETVEKLVLDLRRAHELVMSQPWSKVEKEVNILRKQYHDMVQIPNYLIEGILLNGSKLVRICFVTLQVEIKEVGSAIYSPWNKLSYESRKLIHDEIVRRGAESNTEWVQSAEFKSLVERTGLYLD